MTLAALELTLDPLPVLRSPGRGGRVVELGFALRLPDHSVVAVDDPLLAAFATVVTDVVGPNAEDEALQHEAFDPGQPVRLLIEGVDEDGDEIVGVWDADGLRRAGTIAYRLAAQVAAAEEHGLELRSVVLTEHRTKVDDRRCALSIVIAPEALVAVRRGAASPTPRRRLPVRPRLVLVADGRADLRWWDPSAAAGPIPLADVPVSADLSAELTRLGEAYAARPHVADSVGDDPFEAVGQEWAQDALQTRIRAVWTRARAELGRRYAVGLLAPGMVRPAWSPDELHDDDDDDDDDDPF